MRPTWAAEVLRLDGEWKLEAIVAQKSPISHSTTSPRPSIRLSRPATSPSSGARLHERESDVTRGGAISGVALERELSTIGTVIQELRRDIDAKLAESLGGQGIVTIGDVRRSDRCPAAKASVTAVQALAASIANIGARAVVGGGLAVAATAGGITHRVCRGRHAGASRGGVEQHRRHDAAARCASHSGHRRRSGTTDPAEAAAIVRTPVYFDKTSTLTLSKLFSREGQAHEDVRVQKLVSTVSPFNDNYAGAISRRSMCAISPKAPTRTAHAARRSARRSR